MWASAWSFITQLELVPELHTYLWPLHGPLHFPEQKQYCDGVWEDLQQQAQNDTNFMWASLPIPRLVSMIMTQRSDSSQPSWRPCSLQGFQKLKGHVRSNKQKLVTGSVLEIFKNILIQKQISCKLHTIQPCELPSSKKTAKRKKKRGTFLD